MDFTGRASRSEYWWFTLAYIVAITLLMSLLNLLGLPSLGLIFALAAMLPLSAVAVRRMHDIGKTGWLVLIGLIPVVGAFVLVYFHIQPSIPAANQWGSPAE